MMRLSRGTVIVAVLLLLVLGVIIAAGVLGTAGAAAKASRAETVRTQARAIAWSGVQAVMADLSDQREDILEGAMPKISEEWSLYTSADGTRAVVRLIDLSPNDPTTMLAAENTKIDLNTATVEMLEAIPGLDASLAKKIIAARDQSRLTSVESLLSIEGITPELVYGSLPAVESNGDGFGLAGGAPNAAAFAMPGDVRAGGVDAQGAGLDTNAQTYLSELCTVFSFDPNLQLGLDNAGESLGVLRVNLNQPWSDRLGEAIADRINEDASKMVGALKQGGQDFSKDSVIVELLIGMDVEPKDWVLVFDIFTTSDELYLPGRVDLNLASASVLAAVPGIDEEHAQAIVDHRSTMSELDRRSVVWPVIEGVLEPAVFQTAVEYLTTRSMQWRVRLEAGFERGEPGAGASVDELVPMTLDDLAASFDEEPQSVKLESRVVVEAVIDIASSRPRVAYMRDVSLFDPVYAITVALADAEQAAGGDVFGEDSVLPSLEDEGTEPLSGFGSPDEGFGGLGGFGDPGAMDDGLSFGGNNGSNIGDRADENGSGFGSGFGDGLGKNDQGNQAKPDEADSDQNARAGTPNTPSKPGEMVDRRIGRWTARKTGESK